MCSSRKREEKLRRRATHANQTNTGTVRSSPYVQRRWDNHQSLLSRHESRPSARLLSCWPFEWLPPPHTAPNHRTEKKRKLSLSGFTRRRLDIRRAIVHHRLTRTFTWCRRVQQPTRPPDRSWACPPNSRPSGGPTAPSSGPGPSHPRASTSPCPCPGRRTSRPSS